MLVLTRRPGESIMINDNIRVEVLTHVGNTIRIGIQAPPEIPVHREEVWWRMHNGEYSLPNMNNKFPSNSYSYVSSKGVKYTVTQNDADGNNYHNGYSARGNN